ncbi:hypothetical protein NBH00_05325 [Paraconexibacter antarcticus]|uniref:AlpA family phage regulatory protein n=1 Tax=Paraconexibacter antarcticus TaxID=2949664 RepID=A0ABY5DXV0_9ACTN|nr:hypothetical protein [Paraconexibacter antarcticus]UTI65632.1 hypothetical protein NBH00_05325 [Paraconexibacter antarcticus]
MTPVQRNATRAVSAIEAAGGLYNLTGLAGELGLSRQRMSQLAGREDFPQGLELNGEADKLWLLDEVKAWDEARHA